MSRVFFSIIAILISFWAFGAEKDYFPYGRYTDAELLIDLTHNKKLNWSPWVKGSDRCLNEIDQQQQQLQDYYQSFLNQNQNEADRLFSAITKGILQATDCRESLWISYLVGSFELGPYVNPKTGALPKAMVQSGRGPEGYLKNEMMLLVLSLANSGHIQPLTEEVRKQLSNGSESELWLLKEEGHYLVTGYYHCRDSKLYIGFDLKPFNLASATTHEITHWFEDKIGFSGFFSNVFNLDKSVQRFVIMDELKATLNGAFFQRSLLHPDLEQPIYSHTVGDMDFFAKSGSLDMLYENLQVPLGLNLSSFYHNYLSASSSNPAVKNEICNMMTLISEGYFNQTPDCSKGLDFPGVSWMDSLDFRLHVLRESRLRGDASQVLGALKKYLEYSIESSWACEYYIETQSKGLLNNYVGTALGKGGSGGNGGVRPCLRVKF